MCANSGTVIRYKGLVFSLKVGNRLERNSQIRTNGKRQEWLKIRSLGKGIAQVGKARSRLNVFQIHKQQSPNR